MTTAALGSVTADELLSCVEEAGAGKFGVN